MNYLGSHRILLIGLNSKFVIMGSQAVQANLWGQSPRDWAAIQEATSIPSYEYVLGKLTLSPKDKLLDLGCGSGLFCSLAAKSGALITGLDATAELIDEAKRRDSSIPFQTGEIEELPFADKVFDVVTGFNSFQYTADIKNALHEARRVLKDPGRLVIMIWGSKEECEAATYLKAVGSLLPPPPAGAPGPFALSENHQLEQLLEQQGWEITTHTDQPVDWIYENTDMALRGLMSAGPVAKAIAYSGREKATQTITAAVQPYIQPDGRVVYHNTFRIVFAKR